MDEYKNSRVHDFCGSKRTARISTCAGERLTIECYKVGRNGERVALRQSSTEAERPGAEQLCRTWVETGVLP